MRMSIMRTDYQLPPVGLFGMRIAFCVCLAALLLFLGSVRPFPLHTMSLAVLVLCLLTTALLPLPRTTRTLFYLALGMAILLTLWVVLQTIDIGSSHFANPAWSDVQRLVGSGARTISIAPGDTMEALVPTVLPFIVFLTCLQLFDTDEPASRFLRLVTVFGVLAALFGILQFLLFPKMLMLTPKIAYLDSLTAIFVNRNTAATYLGMTLILCVTFLFSLIQKVGVKQYVALAFGMPTRAEIADRRWALVFALGAIVVFVALMLTKSRAGVASSLISLAAVLLILAFFGGQRSASAGQVRFPSKIERGRRRTIRITVVMALIFLAGAAYSGRVMLRASSKGLDDQRFCVMPGMVRMIKDNWLTGTGLGTFQDAFPAYRDPSCGIRGVFEKAHNVYVEGMITLGLPFAVLAIIVVGALTITMIRGIRNRRQLRWTPIAGLGILLLFVLHSAVDFSIQIPGLATAAAAVLGAISTISLKKPERGSKSKVINRPSQPGKINHVFANISPEESAVEAIKRT